MRKGAEASAGTGAAVAPSEAGLVLVRSSRAARNPAGPRGLQRENSGPELKFNSN